MKYEAMYENRNKFSVRKMCKVLEVKESNYYRWQKRQKEKLKIESRNLQLVMQIEQVFNDNHRVYGYRKMQLALEEKGIKLTYYRIRKIMKENGLYPEIKVKFKPYPKQKSEGQTSPNRINQDFKTEKPNQVWVGDITYIKTNLGWVYLAAVIDLYNREVIGYATSKKIDTELVKRALSNAIKDKESVKGVIFHSDRGCQYASKGYKKMLSDYGMIGSMSRPGCPYDNSCMESFFASLKKEYIYRRLYDTIEQVRIDLFEYIELFYNRKRLHSYLGYMSPVEYRMKYNASKIA